MHSVNIWRFLTNAWGMPETMNLLLGFIGETLRGKVGVAIS